MSARRFRIGHLRAPTHGETEMESIIQGVAEAMRLLFTGDPSTYEIALRSLVVSMIALLFALAFGLPLGAMLALTRFPGHRALVATVNTGMGVPPVVIGLLVALFLWRTGPLGGLHLMYTIQAMIIAQVLIALPIVAGLSYAALQQLDAGFRMQILALGAGRLRLFFMLVREIRVPLMGAVMAAFGGVISEVGAVMIVGGNIRGQTEVLTTGIVTNVEMGLFPSAVALAIVLMILSFTTNYAMTVIQQHGTNSGQRRQSGFLRASRSRLDTKS